MLRRASLEPGANVFDNGAVVRFLHMADNERGRFCALADPISSNAVEVDYNLTSCNGVLVESTQYKYVPSHILLSNVIPMWKALVPLMVEGDVWRIVTPSEIGYGARGEGYHIRPYCVLTFEIHLRRVLRGRRPREECRQALNEMLHFDPRSR